MKREFIKTSDGSYTLSVPELNEHYHSIHGAATESLHIFINAGLNICKKAQIRVLEYGMGTGLNVYLSYVHGLQNKKKISYRGIEKYPVSLEEARLLNREGFFEDYGEVYELIHGAEWEKEAAISTSFSLYKQQSDFREFNTEQQFDVIYFDAFAPDIQPGLWTEEIFHKIYAHTSEGGILTTYSAKGQVRRNLIKAGFFVEKLPGPPGKREFLRAVKGGL